VCRSSKTVENETGLNDGLVIEFFVTIDRVDYLLFIKAWSVFHPASEPPLLELGLQMCNLLFQLLDSVVNSIIVAIESNQSKRARFPVYFDTSGRQRIMVYTELESAATKLT
jgi:hypothetical protein